MTASRAADFETGSLAELVMKLGAKEPVLDEAFARRFAMALHAKGAHVRLPLLEQLGLRNIIVTFHMDRQMKVVVTGTLADAPGEVTLTWPQEVWGSVPVTLLAEPNSAPYLFATLDFSCRGEQRRLKRDIEPFCAGQQVTLRALATIGDRVEMRIHGLGLNMSVNQDDLEDEPGTLPAR